MTKAQIQVAIDKAEEILALLQVALLQETDPKEKAIIEESITTTEEIIVSLEEQLEDADE